MQHVVIGVDDEGRSCVVETRAPITDRAIDAGGAMIDQLCAIAPAPFDVAVPRRAPGEATLDLGFGPGEVKWIMGYLLPGAEPYLHRTDTIDLQHVLEGDVVLHLEVGSIALRAGDTVVIPGLVHGWAPGPRGCVLSGIGLGLPTVD